MSDLETWVDLFQWEAFYQVSDLGNVRSKNRILKKYPHSKPRYIGGVILKHILNDRGYPCVNLTDGARRKQYHIHLAVMRSFKGPCEKGLEVCHNDGNPLNTALSNLRYDTRQNNNADMVAHGTRLYGESVPNARLNSFYVKELRTGSLTMEQVMRLCGVSLGCVSKAKYRQTWKHV